MSTDQTQNNTQTTTSTTEDKVDKALKKLHHEIDFASKALDSKSNDFGSTLRDATSALKLLLTELEDVVKLAKNQNTKMIDELTTFTILPEKITKSIQDIVPDIALEVENIHKPRMSQIQDQFTSVSKDISSYGQELKKQTNEHLTNLSSKVENLTTTSRASLDSFQKQLLEDAEVFSEQKSWRSLKGIAITVLFSAIVSSSTSYLVVTQFPKYVSIKSSGDVTVYNSRVDVWDSKTKEQPRVKIEKLR